MSAGDCIRHLEVFGSRLTAYAPPSRTLCDQCNAGHHQSRAEHPPPVKRMNIHAEPTEFVDHQ